MEKEKANLGLSIGELEAMTVGELAELLANIVLLLRRLPANVRLCELRLKEQDKEEE